MTKKLASIIDQYVKLKKQKSGSGKFTDFIKKHNLDKVALAAALAGTAALAGRAGVNIINNRDPDIIKGIHPHYKNVASLPKGSGPIQHQVYPQVPIAQAPLPQAPLPLPVKKQEPPPELKPEQKTLWNKMKSFSQATLKKLKKTAGPAAGVAVLLLASYALYRKAKQNRLQQIPHFAREHPSVEDPNDEFTNFVRAQVRPARRYSREFDEEPRYGSIADISGFIEPSHSPLEQVYGSGPVQQQQTYSQNQSPQPQINIMKKPLINVPTPQPPPNLTPAKKSAFKRAWETIKKYNIHKIVGIAAGVGATALAAKYGLRYLNNRDPNILQNIVPPNVNLGDVIPRNRPYSNIYNFGDEGESAIIPVAQRVGQQPSKNPRFYQDPEFIKNLQTTLGEQGRLLLNQPDVNPYYRPQTATPIKYDFPKLQHGFSQNQEEEEQDPSKWNFEPEPQLALPPHAEEEFEFVKGKRGRKVKNPEGTKINSGRNYQPTGKQKGRPKKGGSIFGRGPVQNQVFPQVPIAQSPLPQRPIAQAPIPPPPADVPLPLWKRTWNKLKKSNVAKLVALAAGVGLTAYTAKKLLDYHSNYNRVRNLQNEADRHNLFASRVRQVNPSNFDEFRQYRHLESQPSPVFENLKQPVEEEHWNFEPREAEEQKEEDDQNELRQNKEQFRALYVPLNYANKMRIDRFVENMKLGLTRQQKKDFKYPYQLFDMMRKYNRHQALGIND